MYFLFYHGDVDVQIKKIIKYIMFVTSQQIYEEI